MFNEQTSRAELLRARIEDDVAQLESQRCAPRREKSK